MTPQFLRGGLPNIFNNY